MFRQEAIHRVALLDLSRLSSEERSQALEIIILGLLELLPDWAQLPAGLRKELHSRKLETDPNDPRYDPALLLWLKYPLANVSNEYLASRLKEAGEGIIEVYGDAPCKEACPCCGRITLESLGDYEICHQCGWEDDGQDNEDASYVRGGPNGDLSLMQARVNFIKFGTIYPGGAEDVQESSLPEMYEVGRVFVLTSDQNSAVEIATRKWDTSIN